MATVVSVMDRSGWTARTDNIVVVDPAARTLRWIPRDLWCRGIENRINAAFARRGHRGLVEALAEHGMAVEHSVCLARDAVEHALADVEVTVPVERDVAFWYPLSPRLRLQDGRKVVEFRAPAETLCGERVHQWIGARKRVDGGASDLERIARQQAFLRCLWADGFDFGRVVERAEWVSASGPDAYDELRRAQPTWQFETFDDVVPAVISGNAVLLARQSVPWVRRVLRRPRSGLAGLRTRLAPARRASS